MKNNLHLLKLTKQLIHQAYILLFVLISITAYGQQPRYPATINPVLGIPNSIFLSDYAADGTNALHASIVFNDFNEASWTFKLRVKIENNNIRLETMPGFTPPAPIVLAPGVIQNLTGADWEQYFSYPNLNIAGTSVNSLINSGGRLPEGVYSFCFQVLDYDTDDPLSQEICRTVWLKLADAPRINLPVCGTNLDPAQQQFTFAWQAFDTPSPNAVSPDFQLTIWELTEAVSNIQTAVGNGQAVQVFQSEPTKQSTYLYGPSDPPLDLGKQYVYRVQAIDPGGRDAYKNNGNSEFCSFYYGWPAGGQVNLVFPPEGGGFRKKNIPSVQFSTVKPKLPTQAVSYQINVVPWLDGQSREQAIDFNQPWFLYTTPPTTATQNQGKEMPQDLAIMQRYVWQVKAYTGAQEVGKSNIGFFNGPSLMESFWAGGHRVEVDYIDGVNLNDISGGGRIRFSTDPNAWTPITFSHIQITNMGDFFKMTGGEFFYTPNNLSLALNPDEEVNGVAYYDVKRFRVNSDGIYAEGRIRWNLPFATNSTQVAKLVSEEGWANFNHLSINTSRRVAPGNEYDLLEPQQFRLSLSNTGMIYVYDGEYRFDLHGVLELPQHVAGAMNERVKFPFRHQPQLFYMEEDSVTTDQHALAPLPNATLALLARGYVLDLSEQNSPGKWSAQANWKGIYIHNFNFRFSTGLDKKGQLGMPANFFKNINATDYPDMEAWVNGSGLDLKVAYAAEDSVKMLFQTFPSFLKQFNLTVQRNQIISESSILKGAFTLPVVSTERQFAFTVPVNNTGFTDGYLEDLENTSFVHNEGAGDQEIRITIKRAVLSGYEKISMTLDLEWPSMGVTLETLRGFNVWGDYSIGFDRKNGTVPLGQQYNATLSNYPITINVIGAASNDGSYVFATTADAGLGDDVGGGEGAPSINVYSVMPNAYVPLGGGEIGPSNTPTISLEQASQEASNRYTKTGDQLLQALSNTNLLEEANTIRATITSALSQTVYSSEELFQTDGGATLVEGMTPPEDPDIDPEKRELAYSIAKGFITVMSRPVMKPIQDKTKQLQDSVNSVINRIVAGVDSTTRIAVGLIIEPITNELISVLQNDLVDVATPLRQMADAVVINLGEEVASSLRTSANNNIQIPLRTLLEDEINGRLQKFLIDNGTNVVYAFLKGAENNPEPGLQGVVDDAPEVFEDIAQDVVEFVRPDNIQAMLDATAADFLRNISLNDIKNQLRADAERILLQALQNEIGKRIGNLTAEYAQDIGLSFFGGAGGATPINFVGVAKRFKESGIKGVFSVDPVRVQLRTPVIDLDGFISYTPQHPVYGDVWLGDIDMTIKVPKPFAFNAIYFNGKKDGINYWFCQITPPDAKNTPYELGKPLSKKVKEIPKDKRVDIGIAKIAGASGRLYHHMRETPGDGIIPDASMRYGAYMHFVFFDKQDENDQGKNLRLEVSGEINSSENGDYTIAFDGNLQVQSSVVRVMEIDPMAVVQGTVIIRYNSAEEHFFGYAKVVVKHPSLCAQASLLVDVKPGAWRIAIGSREERIIFVPGCGGWSPTGWLDLNQSQAELGLGVQFSAAANESIDLGFVNLNVLIETGFAFGIVAVVQYKPSFALMRAGIWLDAWCIIDVGYQFTAGKKKSIRLADIYIRGDMVLIFNPPPTTIEGSLRGSVKITLFSFNFNAKMRKQL